MKKGRTPRPFSYIKFRVSLYCLFYPLRLNADVLLHDGYYAVRIFIEVPEPLITSL